MTSQVITTPVVRRKNPHRGKLWWRYLIGFVAILFALVPVVWIFLAALNPLGTLSTQNMSIHDFGLDNFRFLFGWHDVSPEVSYENYPYLQWFRNSLVIATIATIMQVSIGVMAAYAFSRIRFSGKKISLKALFLLLQFPSMLSLVALFLIVQSYSKTLPFIGLGTFAGLIVVYLGGSMGFGTFLIVGFMDTIDRSLDEAATVDGASINQIFYYIILPLIRPSLATMTLFTVVGLMNDFLLASIFLTKTSQTTLAVGLHAFVSGRYESNWGVFAAGSLLAAIPVVILYQRLQASIVAGLTAGSVKG